MFSGIIEELGEVNKISYQAKNVLLDVRASMVLNDIKIGDSISVNGVCLTVIKIESPSLVFEVIPETMKITNLSLLRNRDKVNLERSLKIGDRLSGHFVTGHIDCRGLIRKKLNRDGNLSFEITVPQEFMQYIIPKGSVAVDGISLTIADRKSHALVINIIPHTLKNTTLGFKGPSDKVNIEFDILSRFS